ncbi:MAG: T9SS type A sorting domain-containing protein, partial [Paludibacteraceae bacterium]|nr:T9SS type A sorting domain-containing protein [Paludibacteraceae bacterium]
QVYNRKNGTNYDHTEDITFTFTGRFYNEAGLPIYTGLTPEVPVLLNNTYPANIDADMLQSKGYGTIQCYEGHSFVDVTGRTDAVISSGYGFIFTPNVAEFTIPSDCFQTTKVINNRNAEAEVPSLRLQLKNEDVDGVYSTISISHDELKDDAADYAVDAPKLFNDMESNLADLYVMRYDSKWAGLSVPTVEESLPLGIKVRTANQKHRFNLLNSNLDYDIILEDRQEGKEYNLSAGDVCEVSNLAVGDCRGRFYLKTSESSEEDDEVTTDILDNEKSASIDIYAQGNSVVVSSTNNVNIQKIVVSDLSGRQMNYNVSGQYIVLDLPVSSGIYTINVMGDTANRIEKIKLN